MLGVEGDPRYQYRSRFGTPQYSQEFIDWLIGEFQRDAGFFDAARAVAAKSKPKRVLFAEGEEPNVLRAAIAFRAPLQLWSPQRPKLYRVRVSAASDAVEDEIGFRSIAVQGERILLNGEPVYLRGINLQITDDGGAGKTGRAA